LKSTSVVKSSAFGIVMRGIRLSAAAMLARELSADSAGAD
jgi:hypothetical protein